MIFPVALSVSLFRFVMRRRRQEARRGTVKTDWAGQVIYLSQ